NALIIPSFLPGHLNLSTVIALVGCFFAVINRAVTPNLRFIQIPSINRPLLVLGVVILLTAMATGGLGFRILGSSHYGGKRYLAILSAFAGYYALTSQRIPFNRVGLYLAIFFLSSVTAVIGNLSYVGGPVSSVV